MRNLKFTLAVLLIAQAPMWAQTNQYTWPAPASQSVYCQIPGGQGVHQAVLDIDTNGDVSYLEFYLTYHDGTSDLIAYEEAEGPGKTLVVPRRDFNTDDESPYGENVQFGVSETAGYEYALKVSKNDSGGPGTFAADEIWCLTVTGLSGTNDLRALANSKDVGLLDISPDPVVFPNACYWKFDDPSIIDPAERKLPIVFNVPGGQDIHKIILNIEFFDFGAAIDPNYKIVCPKDIDDAAPPIDEDEADLFANRNGSMPDGGSVTVYTVSGSEDDERQIVLSNPSSGKYTVEVIQKSALNGSIDCGNDYCEFTVDEYWQIILSNLPTAYRTFVSVETRDNAGNPFPAGNEKDHLIALTRPPLTIIRKPANLPAEYPYTIIRQRNFTQENTDFDFDPGNAGSFTSSWRLDGSAAPPLIYFDDYDPHDLTLKTDESVDIHSAPYDIPEPAAPLDPFPYEDFTLSSVDRLTFKVVPPEEIGFTRFLGLPYHPDPPVIDAKITDGLAAGDVIDTGWRAAARYTSIDDGGEPANVAFQALKDRDEDYYYFSFEVRNDTEPNDEDLIVMGFRPSYSDTPIDSPTKSALPRVDDVLIFIYPLPDGGSAAATDPDGLLIFKYATDGSDYYWEDITSSVESNFTIRARSFDSDTSWDVEIKMPFSTLTGGGEWVSFADEFLFYYNVFCVLNDDDPNELYAVEFHWPRDAAMLEGVVEAELFSPGEWGEGTKDPTVVSRGVYIDSQYSDIWVEPSDGSGRTNKIMLGDNTFNARLRNNAQKEDETGTPQPVTAEQVKTRFRIAKWGVMSEPDADTGDWSIIPVGGAGDGFTATQDIPGDDTPVVFSKDWNVTQQWIDDNIEYAHQCVYVEIDSDGNANIMQKGYYRNMDFVDASEFSRIATISTKGYEPPPGGEDNHQIIMHVTANAWSFEPDEPEGMKKATPAAASLRQQQSSDDIVSYLRWIVNCFLKTGKGITIKGKKYSLVKPMGSFGYVVRHYGPVRRWFFDIEGARKINGSTYILTMPQYSHQDVFTHIKPIEPLGLSLSLHAGAAVPLPPSNFASDYKTGFCVIGDIGYAIADRFSIMGLFGYNYFPAKSSSMDDASVLNIAVNGKYFIPVRRDMDIGIGLGPELFVHDFNSVEFGYDLDVSYDWRLSRRLALELGGIYHSHFDQEVWFLQIHAGVIVGF